MRADHRRTGEFRRRIARAPEVGHVGQGLCDRPVLDCAFLKQLLQPGIETRAVDLLVEALHLNENHMVFPRRSRRAPCPPAHVPWALMPVIRPHDLERRQEGSQILTGGPQQFQDVRHSH